MDFIKIPHVSNVVLLGRGGSAAAVGDIHITAHQIIFVPLPPPQSTTTTTTTPGTVGNGTTEPGPDITSGACAVPTANQEVWIFHSTVHQIERLPPDPRHVHPRPRLVVHCRDFSLFRFGMPDDARLALVYESLERLVHVDSHEALFAYALGHSTEWPPLHDPASGWHWFDLVSEYRRLGFSDASPPPAAAVPATTSAAGAIRITEVNIDYGICSTYPRFLAVPATILDSTLRHAAKHRSKGRIPAITYRHPTGAALARCSQPLVGVAANRSPQDERFIAAIFDLPIVGRMPPHRRGMVAANEEAMHLIVDARPAINAAANTVKGSGTENMEFYKGARKEYMNIDNIHVMRDSLASMLLMDAGQTIVSTLTRDRAHVLVHCSDGWDRTAQLMSLAQLALDPYYRTLHGFAVLIEKEWLAFGHKFTDRCGHVRPARADSASATSFVHRIRAGVATAAEAREVSPVFHQWLDAVYQLVMTYPDAFEFTPELLAALHWHAYACMAGTFLYNSDAERNEKKLRERTHSVWSMIDKDRAKYLNPAY
ncbi:protein-tyrosine phosphatase-like protein, partial [Blastocladiella britannica]